VQEEILAEKVIVLARGWLEELVCLMRLSVDCSQPGVFARRRRFEAIASQSVQVSMLEVLR